MSDGNGEGPVIRAGRTDRLLSPRVRAVMAGVLSLLLALAVVALGLELFLLKPRYQDAVAAKQARADVVRVAQRFTAQVNNYDVASIDDYQKSVTPMLSTKFKGEFETAMTDIVASVKQAKMTSSGDVLASAVATADRDSAQVLVVADAEVKTVYDVRKRHFRWQVSLVKVDGSWLVDDFQPVS